MFGIHIISHEPHFVYLKRLVTSIVSYMSPVPRIFVFVDTEADKASCERVLGEEAKWTEITSMQTLMSDNNFGLMKPERFESAFAGKFVFGPWGAGGHRSWVAVKRTYSLLFLKQVGLKSALCLDSESLILKEVDVKKLTQDHGVDPVLTICEDFDDKGNWNFPYNVQALTCFGMNLQLQNVFKSVAAGYRQNDFWFIHLNEFSSMIDSLISLTGLEISKWLGGSEQSLYEKYLYLKFLEGELSVELISLDRPIKAILSPAITDMHHNRLFLSIISSDNIDLDVAADVLNREYFNKVPAFRGDYMRQCLAYPRGKELLERLNICLAVSNFQGV